MILDNSLYNIIYTTNKIIKEPVGCVEKMELVQMEEAKLPGVRSHKVLSVFTQ